MNMIRKYFILVLEFSMIARSLSLKRGINAYFAFSMSRRSELKSQGVSMCDASKQCALEWKTTSDEAKKNWAIRAEELNKAREEKIASGELIVNKTIKRNKSDKPRKISGYVAFVMEKRPEIVKANPNLKVTEIMTLIARQWKNVSDEEKKHYADKAANYKKPE